MLECARRESYTLTQFLDTHYVSHRAYQFQIDILKTLTDLNQIFITQDPYTTTVDVHFLATKLLYTILAVINITTTNNPTNTLERPIFEALTATIALYMYNRSLCLPNIKKHITQITTGRRAHIETQFKNEPFYVDLCHNPEHLRPQNQYFKTFSDIKTIHHDIIADKLIHIWSEYPIPDPPTEETQFRAWLAAFAACHNVPEFPINQATRDILNKLGKTTPPPVQQPKPATPLPPSTQTQPLMANSMNSTQQTEPRPPPITQQNNITPQPTQNIHMAVPMQPTYNQQITTHNPSHTTQNQTSTSGMFQNFTPYDPSYNNPTIQYQPTYIPTTYNQYSAWPVNQTQIITSTQNKLQQIITLHQQQTILIQEAINTINQPQTY